MSVDYLLNNWKDVRNGFIDEVAQIPADQFGFKATSETRSVAELIQHVVETQKVLVGETCRSDSNLMRQSFADHMKEYAPGVAEVNDKDGLIALLQESMDQAERTIQANRERMTDPIRGLDGKEKTKLQFLQFGVSHEMYHRGQFTVYARLLNVEPKLTQRLKKLFTQATTN